jgi:hypothetical protein
VFDVHWAPGRRVLGVSLAVWQSDPNTKIATISTTDGTITELTEGASDDSFVEWSHDASHVLYAVSTPDDPYPNTLLSEPAKGGKPIEQAAKATRRLRRHHVYSVYPSPDGKWIAALSEHEILMTKVAGSKVVRLAPGNFIGPLIWSPDSRRILVHRDTTGPYVIDRQGGAQHRLTRNGCCEAVGWSPDARKILVLRQVSDQQKIAHRPAKVPRKDWELYRPWTELWVMDADGGRLTRLPFNRPHWSVLAADWDTPHSSSTSRLGGRRGHG